ncbi:MAG: 16S rRNA (adenine(1518)-N(6)/adenine(1519)-N(6))-dimethyltransferase RsmA [Myxococcales bacterium]|nr:16S rRNA (adenine(1518)-N(6)/adenine(1519)-N(6))-dimethyltransferase RsmA [Myxococcales bacterium]
MRGQLRARLDAFGIHPKKRLGQNFLHDPQVLKRILHVVESEKPSGILEIGPGPGLLTEMLMNVCPQVVAIEKDSEMVSLLTQEFRKAGSTVQVVEADFLTTDIHEFFPALKPVIVGNIPYNLSTPIVLHLLAQRSHAQAAVLMLQAELAQRLRAPVGSRQSGSLTVLLQLLSKVELVTSVAAGCFFPPPKVESEVIRIVWRESPAVPVASIDAFEQTVRVGFNQRRKKLGNALASRWNKSDAAAAIGVAGIDPNKRAEHLLLEDWAKLSNALLSKG